MSATKPLAAGQTDFNAVVSMMTWELRKAFPVLDDLDIAAIGGNGGHESNGFQTLQEIKPTVAGSAGGYGYFQWTGPRRRAFMAWCRAHDLDPASLTANVGFLVYELQTSESAAIGRVRKAQGLEAKVKAFELGYERAGVKHYPSRVVWAKKFLKAMPLRKALPAEVEALKPAPPKPLTRSKTIWATISGWGTSGLAATLAALNGMDWRVLAVLLVGGTLAGLVIYERFKKG